MNRLPPWALPMKPAPKGMGAPGGQPPWHMWGVSQQALVNVILPSPGSTIPVTVVNQLAHVEYKRPETWRFLLWFRVDDAGTVLAPVTMTIAFSLSVGVGRSFFNLDRAAILKPATISPGAQGWTNQLVTSQQVLADGTTAFQGSQTSIAAQSIAVTCALQGFNTVGGTPGIVKVTVGAFFSPNVHVRPSWYRGLFAGREDT